MAVFLVCVCVCVSEASSWGLPTFSKFDPQINSKHLYIGLWHHRRLDIQGVPWTHGFSQTPSIFWMFIPVWGIYVIDKVVVSNYFSIFTPNLGEMIQFDSYFSDGLVQPPPSWHVQPCWIDGWILLCFSILRAWHWKLLPRTAGDFTLCAELRVKVDEFW